MRHDVQLPGDELAVRETIAKVQRFQYLVDAVGRKLEVLEKIAQRRVEQATIGRARHMGELLGSLSVLTLITVTITLISEVMGARGDGPGSLVLRLVLVAAAVVGAFFLYWTIYIRTARTRSTYPGGRRAMPRPNRRHERSSGGGSRGPEPSVDAEHAGTGSSRPA